MFLHAAVTGWSEHECTICWVQREPSPKWDLGVEPTTMELVGPDSMCQDTKDLYWDVYQLHRLPEKGQCEEATEEQLHKEVLDSIKEHLWLKQLPTHPEREQMQLPADAPQPNPHMAFAAMNCSTYEFSAMNRETYEEMMALMRDNHQQALVAAAILEEWMERMSCSASWQCPTSCHWSSRHWWSSSHRRSRSLGQWQEGSQVTSCYGEPKVSLESPQANSHQGGKLDINFFHYWQMPWATSCWRGSTAEWTWSPSSTRWRHQVTFAKERAPMPEESPKHDAREDMAYRLPPPMWQTEEVPYKKANWLRPWEGWDCPGWGECGSQMSPTTGAPSPTTPEWWGTLPSGCWGVRWPAANVDITPPSSMLKHPEPSPLHASDWIEWWVRHVQMLSWWGEFTKVPSHKKTTKNLPRRCMPPLKYLRHATGQRGWITTMCNHWHIPTLESTNLCCWRTWGLAPKTSISARNTIPLPLQGPCSIGLRRHNPQSPANLIVWWEVY